MPKVMPEVLFIGAHPDDLEIGASGTIRKLVSKGYRVNICILTNEADQNIANIRRQEAINAASHLGIKEKQIIFLGLIDGEINKVNKYSVSRLRGAIQNHGIKPDFVVTHSLADSHSDHRGAANLTIAAFRDTIILGYAVVNHLMESDFKPLIFVDISDYREEKIKALKAHKTQAEEGRIKWDQIDELNTKHGREIGVEYAEAFDMKTQIRSEEKLPMVMEINDSLFHKFWYKIIDNREMYILEEDSYRRHEEERRYDEPNCLYPGAYITKREFENKWMGKPPSYMPSSDRESLVALITYDVLISGGPLSNWLTLRYFNHFFQYEGGIRYIVNYDMPPDNLRARIWDRVNNKPIEAEYADRRVGSRGKISKLIRDKGILTIMRNPFSKAKYHDCYLISCAGIHSWGTMACHKALVENEYLSEIMKLLSLPIPSDILGYQTLVEIGTQSEKVYIHTDSEIFHVIKPNE